MIRKFIIMLVAVSLPSFIGCTSNDATLSNLTISAGTLAPAFDSTVASYTDEVANEVTSVTVTPTAASITAQGITVNGITVASGTASSAIALEVGSNTISIVVTAQDGITLMTYTITVLRKGAVVIDHVNLFGWWKVTSATPKDASINGSTDENFDPITENRTDALIGAITVYVHAYYNIVDNGGGNVQMNRYAELLKITSALLGNVTATVCGTGTACAGDTVACDYEFLPGVTSADLTVAKTGDIITVTAYALKLKSDGSGPVNPPKKDTTKPCSPISTIVTTLTVIDGATEQIQLAGDPQRPKAKLIRADPAVINSLLAAYNNTTCADDDGNSIPCLRNKVAVCPNDECVLINQ